MFRKFFRLISPNPFELMLKEAKNNHHKNILLAWNRGLGDIALGLYAMILRIKTVVPDAKISFLIRKDLEEGFSLLKDINVYLAPDWERGKPYDISKTFKELSLSSQDFDLIIQWPDPTYWVKWQRGKVVPKLLWKEKFYRSIDNITFSDKKLYVGIQPLAETNYGLWRNWSTERWQQLFNELKKNKDVIILLFGNKPDANFKQKNIVDLRGKTNLFQLLSLIQKHCFCLILPDSGILSMTYYLDKQFPIDIISLWADPNHGILKQNVLSPNLSLRHHPLIGKNKDLSMVSIKQVVDLIEQAIERKMHV